MSCDAQSAFSICVPGEVIPADSEPNQRHSRSEGAIAFALASTTILFVSVVGVLMARA